MVNLPLAVFQINPVMCAIQVITFSLIYRRQTKHAQQWFYQFQHSYLLTLASLRQS